MLDFTSILRPAFGRIVRSEAAWLSRSGQQATQEAVLRYLTGTARATLYGEAHGFRTIRCYADYARKVPLSEYPDIRPYVERMLRGGRDILWPGTCSRFAQSSGTSDGKSKYIPVTVESLHLNHFPGAKAVVAHYLNLYPDSRLLGGKSFILGGSFANELQRLPRGVRVGDLSANLIDSIPAGAELLRVPSRRVALMADWRQKLPALVEASLHEDITNISGVPSWFLTVLREVIKAAGADNIHDVWPQLEVFFHGGIAFGPYRSQYEAITDPARMRYLETYNASEGFFAVADTVGFPAMKLLLDSGIFYEFVDIADPDSRPVPAWRVEPGRVYAMYISAPNGLWRYALGDTVRIETVEPLRITIAGRTKAYINAFGEEVMVHNADAAIARACDETGARVLNYHAAPLYAADGRRGRHQWLIEWDTAPASTDDFADRLDRALQQVNSDYQAKRSGDIFLDRAEVITARPGLFDDWLASTGKLGGQRKVPRLANDRKIIDNLINLNT